MIAQDQKLAGFQLHYNFDERKSTINRHRRQYRNINKDNTGWQKSWRRISHLQLELWFICRKMTIPAVRANQVIITQNLRLFRLVLFQTHYRLTLILLRQRHMMLSWMKWKLDLDSRTSNGTANSSFVLYQNQPNPFSEQTRIGFDMPRASNATLSVYDLNSKLVYRVHFRCEKIQQCRNKSFSTRCNRCAVLSAWRRRYSQTRRMVVYFSRLNSFCSKEFTVFGMGPS